MKFIQLEIKNLASLDRQGGETIHFEKGALGESTIFSIVGPTGSGKSTILDAICLALYNRAPRYPRKKGDRNQNIEIYGELEDGERNRLAPTDARNILTRGRKEGYSKLTFLANNGITYRAEWYVRQKTKNYDDAITSLYKIVRKNGVLTEEIDKWDNLPQIIGLEYDQFLRTVLIAQGSFANFLTSKENDRYELLEKLIGCEELYTNITAKIKAQKDEAVKAYNQIVAEFAAQEKDIIPEEELTVLTGRVAQLEEEEKKAKAELEKIKESLRWYSQNEKLNEDIQKYEKEFAEAQQNLNAIKEQIVRLALHDSTLPAVAFYKEMKTAEKNVAKQDVTLQELNDKISKKQQEIKQEEEVNLVELKKVAQLASDEWEKQKPHINTARTIQTELVGARKIASEKEAAKAEAEDGCKKAEQAFNVNSVAIENAGNKHRNAQKALEDLLEEIKNGTKEIAGKVSKATTGFETVNKELESCNAAQLQENKTAAEKKRNDWKDAIRIQDNLKGKSALKKQHTEKRQQLKDRNASIANDLKNYKIEELTEELNTLTQSYTLMSSENWEQHRTRLKEGVECPLCGATHHPYHNSEVVVQVLSNMKGLLVTKKEMLRNQTDAKQVLTEELSKNEGMVMALEQALTELEAELEALADEWKAIHEIHPDWPEEAEVLRTLKTSIEAEATVAAEKLSDYNKLARKVEDLRKAKEKAEKEQRDYEKSASDRTNVAQKNVNDAYTTLETEKGKKENLENQRKEKADALKQAIAALQTATDDVASKIKALEQEIGDKDPDIFEKELNQAKTIAEKAVTDKTEEIGRLREALNGLQGNESATRKQRQEEKDKISSNEKSLSEWLWEYNENQAQEACLTTDDIALLYGATDNWEEIRARQKRLNDACTSAGTTLRNTRMAHEEHLTKKPEESKEALDKRQAEIEGRSNAEMVDLKARLKNHETAKKQMGNMYERKQQTELIKKEWEEITDAIGADGKTLRKIAQCYTLRFLIEHANVEIRKFNSRYELQQVRNSLGIRVIDHDRADDIRDTTSLSGGETFIVSLGLALGLSALSSRNISFENLFIDEGFGTLDPDTLATVIDSLAMLQSSQGKKVGVISHTDTMSERITTQIRIIKNGNSGSSHIEIYP